MSIGVPMRDQGRCGSVLEEPGESSMRVMESPQYHRAWWLCAKRGVQYENACVGGSGAFLALSIVPDWRYTCVI